MNKLLAAITTLLVKGHTQRKIINGKPFSITPPIKPPKPNKKPPTKPPKPDKKTPTKPPKPERKQKTDDSGDSNVYSSDDDSGVYSSDDDNLLDKSIIVDTMKVLQEKKQLTNICMVNVKHNSMNNIRMKKQILRRQNMHTYLMMTTIVMVL